MCLYWKFFLMKMRVSVIGEGQRFTWTHWPYCELFECSFVLGFPISLITQVPLTFRHYSFLFGAI